jgi:WD40 repeat protein
VVPPGAGVRLFFVVSVVQAKEKLFLVFHVQTGKLLDVFSGHEAPVCGLAFSPTQALIASCSWDKTVRVWDVYRSGAATETFLHGCVA